MSPRTTVPVKLTILTEPVQRVQDILSRMGVRIAPLLGPYSRATTVS